MNQDTTTGFQIGNWRLLQKIGDGSFGNIFQAHPKPHTNQFTNYSDVPIAIKTESITNVKQMLLLEYKVYKEFEGVQGFPRAFSYEESETFSYLVMEKLALTLDKQAANLFPSHFVPKDVLLLIMRDTLLIIEKLHSKGYLYRDVKPANFMLKENNNQIFVIDFGLCKKYEANGRHIPMKVGKKLVGTPIFCSLNTHEGVQQSRRDDLESWAIQALYLSMNLPWEPIVSRKDLSKQEQYEEIYKVKKSVNWEQVIRENQKSKNKTKIPLCLIEIISYVRRMKFEEAPNYFYLHKLLADEYSKTTNLSMEKQSLSWASKIVEREKNSQSPSPVKKIKKINFKAPIRLKENNSQINSVQKTKEKERTNE